MGAAPTMRATYQRTPAHSRYSRREASAAGRVHARSEGGPPLRARSRTTSSTIAMRCPAAVNDDLVGRSGSIRAREIPCTCLPHGESVRHPRRAHAAACLDRFTSFSAGCSRSAARGARKHASCPPDRVGAVYSQVSRLQLAQTSRGLTSYFHSGSSRRGLAATKTGVRPRQRKARWVVRKHAGEGGARKLRY